MARTPGIALSRRRFLMASTAAGVTLALPPRFGWGAEEKKLNVYNWDTYIGENTVANFVKLTGIDTQYDLYADNEEMFAKLKEGNPGYDLIFPSDYMVETMISLDMLVPLDHGKIPNIGNVDKNFANPAYDPGLKHSLPYMWGTMGIGYRKSKVDGVPNSWSYFFGPESEAFAGRLALLGDQRAVLGCALKYQGHSVNTTNAAEIAAARDLVIANKSKIKQFAPDSGQDLLLAGEVDLVMEWNGDIVQVMAEDADLAYVVPREGSIVWTDNICIPKGGPHPDNAHAFINYIYDAEVNAEIANFIHYATPNAAARPLLVKEDLANPAIYPPDEVIAKCESMVDVGDYTKLYDDAWTRIKAA